MFRKLIATCSLAALFQCAQAQFTFPVYEPFSEYVNGENLGTAGSSGVYWNVGNSASSSQIISDVAALSYVGLNPDSAATPLGLRGPTGVGRTREAVFTAQTSGTVYASVLINLKSYPSGNRAIFGLTSANGGTPNPSSGSIGVWVNSAGQLQISKNQTTPATNHTVALPLNTTHMLVISYTFVPNATTNDVISLWLDPFQLGDNGNMPAPALTLTNYTGSGSDSTSVQGVVVYAPSSTPAMQVYYDEIRVDNNWAGVTPNAPVPGPIFGVTLSGDGNGCTGDSFPVGLTGSVTSDAYLLYTNSVFSGQMVIGTGSAITFGPQSETAIYTVVASNLTSAAVGWMSNSISIRILEPPNITKEPSPVTVVNNGVATFSVLSDGTGLHYQWYKNGVGLTDGGNISGSTTPTLTIFPATSADQGTSLTGYYVIITNRCADTQTSFTNALTIGTPANIVWQGGNPDSTWDLATTANWTNSQGAAVVFNSGDNVTFDDTSLNPNVTLAGDLAPSVINEAAYQAYSIGGSGTIIGPGSLVMSLPGSLTISNANSFTGGTTITNGATIIVKDPNQMALGYGPVTLGGGTLSFPIKSTVATIGLTNNVNLTADSTIDFQGAGSYSLNLFGAINGSPSHTLTINHSLANSSIDRVRLYGIFTNNVPITISTYGSMVEFSPYNPSGNQVYNGVISGFGGRIAPHGSGNVILNGANTINDSGTVNAAGFSLFYGGGNVGIGADSVSTTPPTIDSSPVGTGNVGIDTTSGNDSIFAVGAAHTIANPFVYTSATNSVTLTFSGAYNLTLSGPFTLSGADFTGGTNRTLYVTNGTLATISGVVGDNGLVCGINKTGGGTLALSGTDTYTGPTLVSAGALWVNGQIDAGGVMVTNGSLGGTGTILGPVTVTTPGAMTAGTSAIGTLTINNNLTLGNGVFKLNKNLAQSNDVVVVSGTLANAGNGTITVTNLGPAIAAGDTFTLFSKPVASGNTLTITGGGMNWTNKLAVDGSIQALSAASTIPNYPTNLTFRVSGNTLNIGWPTTHSAWILQAQTNSLSTGLNGSSNAWVDVAGTGSGSTNATVTISPASPTVFFRLRHP